MKIALVHDYLNDFGGAERVLRVLADMYPDAPIYCAFKVSGSTAEREFFDRKIRESRWAWLIRHWRLYSPLRFLLPLIWRSIDLSDFDVVITSCSGYIARGFRVSKKTKVIAYCHTPPRFLYGFETSIDMQKHWPVRVYAVIVNHFLRLFDFWSAQKVDEWIVNSENVRRRVAKFYRKDSKIIYPPVEVEKIIKASENVKKENYFLIVSRLVGAKGLEKTVVAAKNLRFNLKIVGGSAGYSKVENDLKKLKAELLGQVSDDKKYEIYAKAYGFIALARQEDFGMTVVESQAAGTAVIAFNGGGFRESVIDGKTGILINDTDERTIEKAMKHFNSIKWDRKELQKNARRFSREKFESQISELVNKYA